MLSSLLVCKPLSSTLLLEQESLMCNRRVFLGAKSHSQLKWSKLREMETNGIGTEECELQEFDTGPVMIGGNVKALYPSLDGVASAQITAEAVRESKIKFSGINTYFLVVYLFLILGRDGMVKADLKECIPTRKNKSNAMSLTSTLNRDLSNWDFTHVTLSEVNIRNMIANMELIIRIGIGSNILLKFVVV